MPLPIIVVSQSVYQKAQDVFESSTRFRCVMAPDDEAGLVRAIAESGAAHAILGHQKYQDALYRAFPRGRVLARFGVGHDGLDKLKATSAGLLCTNTPGTLDDSVAELTMFMIGAAARHLVEHANAMARGEWRPVLGTELRGRTLAIVGCGRIGSTLARIASAGFGMRVVGYTRASGLAHEPAHYAELTPDFARAVGAADFVSLHIAATPENVHFIDAARLAMMPPRAWLVNTARGAVVNEIALYDALQSRRIAGAALDVFDREPYEPADGAHDLRTLPNVILTPHIGSNTPDANRRMAEAALRNVAYGADGRFAEMNLLNPDVLG